MCIDITDLWTPFSCSCLFKTWLPHLLISLSYQEDEVNQFLHQQCLPIFSSHQLVVINIATRYFVFHFEKQFPTQACLGWAGCPSGGYFHIVSSLTFHNLLTRGPLKLIKSQTVWFISDNLLWKQIGRGEERNQRCTLHDIISQIMNINFEKQACIFSYCVLFDMS